MVHKLNKRAVIQPTSALQKKTSPFDSQKHWQSCSQRKPYSQQCVINTLRFSWAWGYKINKPFAVGVVRLAISGWEGCRCQLSRNFWLLLLVNFKPGDCLRRWSIIIFSIDWHCAVASCTIFANSSSFAPRYKTSAVNHFSLAIIDSGS